MKKISYPAIMLGVMAVASISLAVSPKCSPCQAAKSMRDATAQSIAEAVVMALSVAKQFSDDNELDNGIYCEKCGCGKTRRDELSASMTAEKCGCGKTRRDALASDVYCEKCGCGKTRRDILSALSLVEAAVAEVGTAVSDTGTVVGDAGTAGGDLVAGAAGLVAGLTSDLGSALSIRAPREELADPCDPCGSLPVSNSMNTCQINAQLLALRNCCACVGQLVQAQGNDAKRCCKRLRHKIDNVEDLVEAVINQISASDSVTDNLLVSIIDQAAVCCSATDTVLGDLGSAGVVIDPCAGGFAIAVNATNADVIAWLKGLYILIGSLIPCG